MLWKFLTGSSRSEKSAHGGHSKGEFDDNGLALLDTMVDVIGNSWGFWRLGIGAASASSHVNTGRIAPATAQILKKYKIPAYSTQSQYELATPPEWRFFRFWLMTLPLCRCCTSKRQATAPGKRIFPASQMFWPFIKEAAREFQAEVPLRACRSCLKPSWMIWIRGSTRM